MGFRNVGSLLIIFLILMMVFGTHRLREIGNDLAAAIRNFRKGLQDEPDEKTGVSNTTVPKPATTQQVLVQPIAQKLPDEQPHEKQAREQRVSSEIKSKEHLNAASTLRDL